MRGCSSRVVSHQYELHVLEQLQEYSSRTVKEGLNKFTDHAAAR